MPDEFDSPEPNAGQHQAPEAVPEAEPPDVGESIRQMQARLESIDSRLDAEEGDEESGDPQFGAAQWDPEDLEGLAEASGLLDDNGTGDDLDQVEDLISERVNEAVAPVAAQLEYGRRVDKLHALAEKYPALRDPETIEEIGATAERIAEAYGIPGAESDPGLIEIITQAHAARTAAAGETPAEAGGNQGATLETGAGPTGSGEPELDDQTRSYLDAIAGPGGSSAFTR